MWAFKWCRIHISTLLPRTTHDINDNATEAYIKSKFKAAGVSHFSFRATTATRAKSVCVWFGLSCDFVITSKPKSKKCHLLKLSTIFVDAMMVPKDYLLSFTSRLLVFHATSTVWQSALRLVQVQRHSHWQQYKLTNDHRFSHWLRKAARTKPNTVVDVQI